LLERRGWGGKRKKKSRSNSDLLERTKKRGKKCAYGMSRSVAGVEKRGGQRAWNCFTKGGGETKKGDAGHTVGQSCQRRSHMCEASITEKG